MKVYWPNLPVENDPADLKERAILVEKLKTVEREITELSK